MSVRAGLSWVLGVVLAFTALGVALLPVESAAYTKALSTRYSLAADAGITTQEAVKLSEQVRAYVVDGTGTLPRQDQAAVGFDTGAISHLDDVRGALSFGRTLTLALAVLSACGIAVAGRVGGRAAVARVMGAAAACTFVLVLTVAAAGFSDFDTLFASFHSLFFAAGTWTFPYESLLIRLFPEPFWLAEGVGWGVSTLVLGGAYAALWRVLRSKGDGARAGNRSIAV